MPKLLPGTSPETEFYGITDSGLSLGRPVDEVVRALLNAGVRIIQYREKEKKSRRDAAGVFENPQADSGIWRLLYCH